MGNGSIDIDELRRVVELALARNGVRGASGGWSASAGKGRTYRGATFTFGDDEAWIVVNGQRRPGAGQLLDATAWLKREVGADHAVALLDPEPERWQHDAPSPFRARLQSAVWHGLGIVMIENGGAGAWAWKPADRPQPGDIDEIAGRVRTAIAEARAADEAAWCDVVEAHDSKRAEPLVRKAVERGLGDGFRKSPAKDREFDAMWRHGKADGLWTREEGFPRSVALEVMVTEDVGAPFHQTFDDLGKFDAVIQVRVSNVKTRKAAERLEGLPAVKAEVEKNVPIRFIEVEV